MKLFTEAYAAQTARWPAVGRHILAQFDDETVVVYQAYRPAIADFAVTHGYFGGPFRLDRMSWVKPNFLWMMYRCGWATKEGQETVLAVRLRRTAFDLLLREAVPSSFVRDVYGTEEAWKDAVAASSVRLQWDPDHDPRGAKLERRAIQLGLRGEPLACYAREWLVAIEDVTPFVREQYALVLADRYEELLTPREDVYPVADAAVAARLGLSR